MEIIMSNNLPAATETKEIIAGFGSSLAFEFMQRQATMLASSALVPKEFSIVGVPPQEKATKIANVVIALEMATRMGASPLAVMQNLYIVHGKPSWSSTFIIAAINGCGRFSAMKFEMSGEGDNRTCVAVATEKATGEKLDSPPVSVAIAKKEGWFSKSGSKWQTMPELMLRYRAATLFGRLYAPEILMGMRSAEELEDIEDATLSPNSKINAKATDIVSRFTEEAEIPMTAEEVAEVTPEPEALAADTSVLFQTVCRAVTDLAESSGETADDMISILTNDRLP
jgi:hypothetical protein